nr:hypothetical protein Iba_chr03cCG4590 [Ipomoea batatas]
MRTTINELRVELIDLLRLNRPPLTLVFETTPGASSVHGVGIWIEGNVSNLRGEFVWRDFPKQFTGDLVTIQCQ